MTKKLYYQDAYINSFTTSIKDQPKDENNQWYLILEETAFYPTGGGQPTDLGTLNNRKVINVEEIDGEIRHYIDEPLESLSSEVAGEVDWKRRYDHMQQHSGQHILSAAFEEALQFKTISFHLGKEMLTIDLDVEKLTEEQASEAERLANRVIQESRSIETKWITEAELSQYPMRKQPTVTDDIRLVIIPDFDYNGCGGTHPRSTSEVGAIKILDWEKHKGHIRLQFVCGNRVLMQLHQKNKLLKELTGQLQVPEETMSSVVQRLLEKQKEQEKTIEDMKERLFSYEADELMNEGTRQSDYVLIQKAYQNRPIQELQKLAQHITSEKEDAVVLLVVHNEGKLQLVGAKGTSPTVNLKEAVRNVFPLINGKGGGKESFVQGGGEALMSKEELLQEMVKNV
ncbi:alanyl-tRNA editing protein [Rossellomorea aquimaris]|uniref:alanyl-tRNA editing protein n=1 Tax=Rossellomorea aquimaris TaxID=189382 RepID=UPI0007D04C11|nr:DHHA1 domain-containing protein [Rossellomorea aquimaris]